MGQYYKPVIRNLKTNTTKTIDSLNYGEGIKLMEHCYFDCNTVKIIANELINAQCCLAWIGDYAEYEDVAQKMNREKFKKIMKIRFNEDYEIKNGDIVFNWDRELYLVNDIKQQYIDLKQYQKLYPVKDWCINPIPLLTAVGNGKGSGDYDGNVLNLDKVGLWAFDTIRLTEQKPNSYMKFDVVFVELN